MSLRVVVSRVVAGLDRKRRRDDAGCVVRFLARADHPPAHPASGTHFFSGLNAAEPAQAKRRHRDEGTGQGQS